MNRFIRSLILLAYLFTGITSIVNEGLRGYPTTVTVTERKASPRTQYITAAGIPKHLVPTQFHQLDPGTVSEFTETGSLALFVVITHQEVEYGAQPFTPEFAGRAPPAI